MLCVCCALYCVFFVEICVFVNSLLPVDANGCLYVVPIVWYCCVYVLLRDAVCDIHVLFIVVWHFLICVLMLYVIDKCVLFVARSISEMFHVL